VIVVDDGSRDGTSKYLRNLENKITSLTTTNCGPSAARNLGISLARGLASRLYVDGRSAIRRMDLSLLAAQMARVVRIGKFQLSRLVTLVSLESELLDRLDHVVTGTQ
jgi:glycosyltransferase involved in cell wall biosynthesis